MVQFITDKQIALSACSNNLIRNWGLRGAVNWLLNIGRKGPHIAFWCQGMDIYPLQPERGHTAPHRREQDWGFCLASMSCPSLITVYYFGRVFASFPAAARSLKVGVGCCPQNAFGCRLRQAKRSACPTQGWVTAPVGDVGFSRKFHAVCTTERCKIWAFPASTFVLRQFPGIGPKSARIGLFLPLSAKSHTAAYTAKQGGNCGSCPVLAFGVIT